MRHRSFIAAATGTALLCALAVTGPATAPVGAQEDCGPGTLYFSEDVNENGLYTLDPATGTATLVGLGETGTQGGTLGLAESSDPSVLWGSTPQNFAIINADGSGAETMETEDPFVAEGLGYDPVRDVLYGTINEEFFTVDPTTGERVLELADTPEGVDLEGLAVDPATSLVYGLEYADPAGLYTYDPDTDDWTLVGDTDTAFDSVGLAYDPGADILYGLTGENDGDARLYTIDKETAETTEIGPLGLENEEGGGLAFVPAECPVTTTTSTTTTLVTTTTAAAAAVVTPRFTG